MNLWAFAITVSALIAVVISLLVMDHHERMARTKYTQGHNHD